MPELKAERREPPTARMCQPGRERVNAMCARMAIEDRGQDGDGEAEDRAVADEVPGIRRYERGLDGGAVIHHQDVEDGAADDQRDQGGQERAQAHIADQVAVDRAEREAGQERRRERDPHRLLQDEEGADRREAGEREDRADREVDAAAQHHDGEAGDDDGELAELAGGIGQRLRLEEAVDGAAEPGHRDDQRQERNGVVGPALGQDLADQVIGDEVVAQAQGALLEGHVQTRYAMILRRHRAQFPPPRRGRVRVGATAAPLDAIFARENNPHPNPPPAWGRENRAELNHHQMIAPHEIGSGVQLPLPIDECSYCCAACRCFRSQQVSGRRSALVQARSKV